MNTSTSIATQSLHRALLPCIAFASITGLLGTAPAQAAPPAARSVTVSFRDLDLSSAEGAQALYRRIQSAAKQVCGYAGADVIEQEMWQGCYRHAIEDAVGKVNSPLLTALHTGRRAPSISAVAAR